MVEIAEFAILTWLPILSRSLKIPRFRGLPKLPFLLSLLIIPKKNDETEIAVIDEFAAVAGIASIAKITETAETAQVAGLLALANLPKLSRLPRLSRWLRLIMLPKLRDCQNCRVCRDCQDYRNGPDRRFC